MSVSKIVPLHSWWWKILLVVYFFPYLVKQALGISVDGVILLSFKYSITSDPLGVTQSWNYNDDTPCSWHGVTCGGDPDNSTTYSRVVGLSLPNYQLQGSIPSNMGMMKYLQTLDLSNNLINCSLPTSFFFATELRLLDLSNNRISGQVPEAIGHLNNLQVLNLSDNALVGNIPNYLTILPNLTVLSLKNNYLSGLLPGNLSSVRFFDISSNFINGSLPSDFGGNNVGYLNISHNNLSGKIPPEFANLIPGNATIDLSYNNLTGQIPETTLFLNQDPKAFLGNLDLCGILSNNPCAIPSSSSSLPNVSSPTSPPAIAAIPKTVGSDSTQNQNQDGKKRTGLRTGTIVGIVVGDLAGVALMAVVIFYVYRFRQKRSKNKKNPDGGLSKQAQPSATAAAAAAAAMDAWSSTSSESRGFARWSCLRRKTGEGEQGDTSDDDVSSSESEERREHENQGGLDKREPYKQRTLVTVDGGETRLELEVLLKASAYILGATGSSILYKAVLEDGTSFAVRRIGEIGFDRFKDFETQVRAVAKLVHPNLVRVRGFYWGVDEKLIIYDFVPNGSLASARYRKVGSSPCHLAWEARLRIAKGAARGLTYLHEKKHVHGNLKPSNILLGIDMEPKIGDFGLERLITGDTNYKAGGSARNFGSKRSTASRDSFQELGPGPSPSPSPSSISGISPYHAPESLRTLKPNPKWDVYSFGVILLELLSGKVIVVDELGQGNGVMVDDHNRAMRMADVVIRADLEGKEDALLACFKLGFSCASPIPQKRPTMKEALQILEKFPSSSTPPYYGHLR